MPQIHLLDRSKTRVDTRDVTKSNTRQKRDREIFPLDILAHTHIKKRKITPLNDERVKRGHKLDDLFIFCSKNKKMWQYIYRLLHSANFTLGWPQ